MTEVELVSACSKGKAHYLVSEADTEDRDPAQQSAYRFDGPAQGFGITWAVGQKDTVGSQRQCRTGRSGGGYHRHLEPVTAQLTQNLAFEPKVIGNDSTELLTLSRHRVGLIGGHKVDQVLTLHGWRVRCD